MNGPSQPHKRRQKVRHEVWVTFTVFVRREGEKHPWYRHGRGPAVQVDGRTHDQAFRLGERELARLMADLVDGGAS